MQPGYLHFDVRRGLKIELINGALAALLKDHEPVRKALLSLDIGLTYTVFERIIFGVKGHSLQLYCGKDVLSSRHSAKASEIFGGDVVSIRDLQLWLEQRELPPQTAALALKIVEQLICPAMVSPKIYSADAMWIAGHGVLFSALIDTLDPKFITTTKICVGEDSASVAFREILPLNDNGWLNQMLVGIPIIETRNPLPLDVVAVAALKALAGHMGARGNSRIGKVGIGLGEGEALGEPLMVEAIWCEASLVESVTDTGQNSRPRLSSVHEVTGTTSASTDMATLSASLSLHGASAISFHLAQREKNSSCYLVRFLVSDEDKRDALEAFLIKGAAIDVSVCVVERHELNRRLVSVPIGTGNKTSAVRFFEYVFFDKTVRVEPVQEDLDQYVHRTDYSVDVARSDLLLAWKKWRGRVVSEDA